MWYVWLIWAVPALAVLLTFVLLAGIGSGMVTGFNMKPPDEKVLYDKKKVSRQAGVAMLFADLGLAAFAAYLQLRVMELISAGTVDQHGREIAIVALSVCAYLVLVGVIASARGFSSCKMTAKAE